MSAKQKLKHELDALAIASLYFGVWLSVLIVLKKLVLAEYEIKFHGFAVAVMGTLILAKVVLILEHVPFGVWVRSWPVMVDVLLRTALYGLGVLVVLILEKAFDARHQAGGFLPALKKIFQHPEMPHVLANSICLSAALLGYNTFSVLRRHLGEGGLFRLFSNPPGEPPGVKQAESHAI